MINYNRTELLSFIDSYMDTQFTFSWAREIVARILKYAMCHENDIKTQHNTMLFFKYFKVFFTYYAHECDKTSILFSLYYIGVEFSIISVQDDITKIDEFKQCSENTDWNKVIKQDILKTDMLYANQLFNFYVNNIDGYCPCGGLYTLNAVSELEEIYGS